jgi:chemotaxis methyl-accepting protein methylase
MNSRREEDLKSLLSYVFEQRGIDFASYRLQTIKRRLENRLYATGTHGYVGYLSYLKANPSELSNLINTLTIKVSIFFRNPLVFEVLYTHALPELIAKNSSLKIWSVGCANGEEPYSIAILVRDLLKKQGRSSKSIKVFIFATDIDNEAIKNARLGEFSGKSLIEVKKRYMDEYFIRTEKQSLTSEESRYIYRLKDEIVSMVSFEQYDITRGIPLSDERFSDYNLILCRNLLIYLSRELQNKILANLKNILKGGGFLVLGESETLPQSLRSDFVEISPGTKIFKIGH